MKKTHTEGDRGLGKERKIARDSSRAQTPLLPLHVLIFLLIIISTIKKNMH
jgi:hypothetical protein